MMEMKDWISMFVGILVFAFGVLPIINMLFPTTPAWFDWSGESGWVPLGVLIYVVAGLGFYLAVESIIEITNSNSIGWISFFIACALLVVGVLIILANNSICCGFMTSIAGILKPLVYEIIFMIEGIFLMIACFAMEL
ncbi:hypothetical protein HZB01_00505 [Candidatus Woesearchaeota archaeon]|nr:hypothetical protein [Candidatus Woesearchaeota archaeon]